MKKVFATSLIAIFLLGIVVSFAGDLFAGPDPNPREFDECLLHCARWAGQYPEDKTAFYRCMRAYCDELM